MNLRRATVDLRAEPSSRVQGAAYAALRELARGDTVTLLTAAEPSVLMQSLDLGLRHRLSWTIHREGGGFRVDIRHREDAAARDVVELLSGAHRALDAQFVEGLARVNAGDAAGAQPLLAAFAAALRRHIAAEDELLAPFFGLPAEQPGTSPIDVMQREHAEILQQLGMVEESLAADEPSAGEVGAFCAILSGTLAKHEHREEANVFPLWRALLARRPDAERAALLERVRTALEG